MFECPELKREKKRKLSIFTGTLFELNRTKKGTSVIFFPMTPLFYISGGVKLS